MIALKHVNLDDVIFLDIETVRVQDSIVEGEPLHDSWSYKLRYSRESDKFEDKPVEELFKEKAALYAEFAKVACITIGRVRDGKCVLHTVSNHDEKALLNEFTDLMNTFYSRNPKTILSGHAIAGFDIPFIMRRCIINRITPPVLCDVAHLKPWELNIIDSLNLWKATGFYSASLINIAVALGLPSPKSDINGSETSEVYYKEEKGLERIVAYCERDVLTVCNVVRAFMNLDPVDGSSSQFKAPTKLSALNRIAVGLDVTEEDVTNIVKSKKLTKKEKEIAQDIVATLK